MKKRLTQRSAIEGFTLIEMMTSVGLFLVVMTISMGAILGVFDANRKSESLKTVMDNLNFSVESMSREMRFGTNYHCETSASALPPFTAPQNCAGGGALVSFLASNGEQIVYRIQGTKIEKSTDGGGTYIAVTAQEITITSLEFYVTGAVKADSWQPKGLIKIRGRAEAGVAGAKLNTRTDFTLQTLVSQRVLDN
ncbi:MAG: seg [Parcubacteria group bacterium]|nr:seg [Parcubacteria group bacterium]